MPSAVIMRMSSSSIAFAVMIAEHGHHRHANAHQCVQQGLHFRGPAIVGQVAGNDEQIGLVAHSPHLVANAIVALRAEVQISSGCDSHQAIKMRCANWRRQRSRSRALRS